MRQRQHRASGHGPAETKLSGALSPTELALFERLVIALESIAKSTEVRVNGRLITNMPEGSYEAGISPPLFHSESRWETADPDVPASRSK